VSVAAVEPIAFGWRARSRADTVAEWADKTTEIATDGPNTRRTMALAQMPL